MLCSPCRVLDSCWLSGENWGFSSQIWLNRGILRGWDTSTPQHASQTRSERLVVGVHTQRPWGRTRRTEIVAGGRDRPKMGVGMRHCHRWSSRSGIATMSRANYPFLANSNLEAENSNSAEPIHESTVFDTTVTAPKLHRGDRRECELDTGNQWGMIDLSTRSGGGHHGQVQESLIQIDSLNEKDSRGL
jgi:hypothetical protein